MMEVASESRHVPSHMQRTALFLSAMRHFAATLVRRRIRVRYVALDDPENTGAFETEIARAVTALGPSQIVCTHPGEWRVLAMLERVRNATGIPLSILPDDHFITTPDEFAAWAAGRTSLTMEFFYREQRRKTGYLMEGSGKSAKPAGGDWNFDKENRLPFGKQGPRPRPRPPLIFKPDTTTRAVIAAMTRALADLPGTIDSFAWPVTREQALAALDDFITHRLARFGPFEDAMWTSEPTLYHSTLSSSLNLKLLNPRECCERAIQAFRAGKAPLLVFTGARSIGTPDAPTEGEVLADFAATLGVPVASMLVTGYVQNTADEARQAATALRERGLTTPRVLLVTSAVHMPRARAMFQQEGMVVTAFPVGFSSPADRRYSVRDLFPTTVALRHSETAIREFYGRAYYWLRDRF